MANDSLIAWSAPEHLHGEKKPDWYWVVGIISLALTAVAIILGQYITAVFIVVAMIALVVHVSHPPQTIYYEVNDRGIIVNDILYPFLSLDSFWIPHDEFPPKLILKSRKLLMLSRFQD